MSDLAGVSDDERAIAPQLAGGQTYPSIIVQGLALAQIEAQMDADAGPVRGVLVGNAAPSTNFVLVTGSMARTTSDTDPDTDTATLSPDALATITREVATAHPGQRVVGWYQSHPRLGVFLSAEEVALQRSTFAQPWQVGYVYDPVQAQRSFFGWVGGDIVRVPRWEVTTTTHASSTDLPVTAAGAPADAHDDAPVEDAHVDDGPFDDAPFGDAHVDGAPGEDAHVDDAPSGGAVNAPSGDPPSDEATAERTIVAPGTREHSGATAFVHGDPPPHKRRLGLLLGALALVAAIVVLAIVVKANNDDDDRSSTSTSSTDVPAGATAATSAGAGAGADPLTTGVASGVGTASTPVTSADGGGTVAFPPTPTTVQPPSVRVGPAAVACEPLPAGGYEPTSDCFVALDNGNVVAFAAGAPSGSLRCVDPQAQPQAQVLAAQARRFSVGPGDGTDTSAIVVDDGAAAECSDLTYAKNVLAGGAATFAGLCGSAGTAIDTTTQRCFAQEPVTGSMVALVRGTQDPSKLVAACVGASGTTELPITWSGGTAVTVKWLIDSVTFDRAAGNFVATASRNGVSATAPISCG